MAAGPPPVPADRSVLAGRIQGFGNVNPPPLEEETAGTVAKKAVGRLGNIVGEEVMLTVEDFREKGAVGAVKDAVADAGDILIDGVAGLVGWIRGDPPPEEEDPAAEDATKALSQGPAGAAYGISQASPTGGINAVWVMPEEADPATLAQLSAEQSAAFAQQHDPRIPKNIQPYQPPPSAKEPPRNNFSNPVQFPGAPPIAPYQPAPAGPGGPMIAPYQPAPAGMKMSPFVPGGAGGMPPLPQGRWGPSGYNPSASGSSPSVPSGGGQSGVKSLVERIAKGEVIYGPEVAKRLVGQCNATKVSAKQLSDIVCERARRLYLGLDGGDPADADVALLNLLGLTKALAGQSTPFATEAAKEIKTGVSEEFLSLRSSAKHKVEADPMLAALGLVEGGQAGASSDLLDSGATAATSAAAPASSEADLLGAVAPSPAPLVETSSGSATAGTSDLDGLLYSQSSPPAGLAGLSMSPAPATSSPSAGLESLTMPAAPAPAPAPAAEPPKQSGVASMMQGEAALASLVADGQKKESKDAFSFVGDELSKASTK